MSSSDDQSSLLRSFATAETVEARAEALRQMFVAKRVDTKSDQFIAGVRWLTARVREGRDDERWVALATLAGLHGRLTKERKAEQDRELTLALSVPLARAEVVDAADRERVAEVVGRLALPWSRSFLTWLATQERAPSSKARERAMASVVASSVSLEEALREFEQAVTTWVMGATPPAELLAKRVTWLALDLAAALPQTGLAPGGGCGPAVRAFASLVDRRPGPAWRKQNELVETVDAVVALANAIVRLRVSTVTDVETYAVLSAVRSWATSVVDSSWVGVVRKSSQLTVLRFNLREGLLLRARAGIPDDGLMGEFVRASESPARAKEDAVTLAGEPGLDPAVQQWLRSGVFSPQPAAEASGLQQEGELPRIAELLRDTSRLSAVEMEGAGIDRPDTNPATDAARLQWSRLYAALLESVEALGRSRDLRVVGAQGAITDFLPTHHRLVGAHAAGVSRVRVLRPAVEQVRANGTVRVVLPALVEAVAPSDASVTVKREGA